MKRIQRFLTFFLCIAVLTGSLPVWGATMNNTTFESAMQIKPDGEFLRFYTSEYSGTVTYYKFTLPGRGKVSFNLYAKLTSDPANNYKYYNTAIEFTIYTQDKKVVQNCENRKMLSNVGSYFSHSVSQELDKGMYFLEVRKGYQRDSYRGDQVFMLELSSKYTCNHENTIDKTTVQPTCSSAGEQVTTCSDCSQTVRIAPLDKLPHTLPDEWETTRAATCAKEGEKIKRCTVCGEIAETEIIACPDHTFGEWETSRQTTCAAAGEKKRVCTECSFTETEPIKALEHTYGDWSIAKSPTCSAVGTRQRTCSVCGYVDSEEVQKLEHKFGKWEVTEKATCTKKGERVRTCSVCSEEQKEEIPLDDHTYGAWNVTSEPTCRNTGKRERTCSVCREKQTEEMPMTSHDYGSWRTQSKATEQSSGSEYRTCSECGKKDTRTLPRLVHGEEYEWKVTKNSTCTETGIRTKYCTYCGKSVTTESLPKAEHNYGAWVTVTSAAYKRDGLEKRTCTKCGAVENRTIKYNLPGKAAFKTKRGYESFSDVGENDWFYRYVKTAYEYKLANGVGNAAFSPDNRFTVAQVLTVAANIHTAYCGTTVQNAAANEAWYMPYVRYCLEQGLIKSGQFDDYTRNITRGEMAVVFASLLPDEEYQSVVSGSNPDVKSDMPCYQAVSKLFKAGIVSGDAGSGNFRPNDEIKRSEACVIFTRIAAPEYRIGK